MKVVFQRLTLFIDTRSILGSIYIIKAVRAVEPLSIPQYSYFQTLKTPFYSLNTPFYSLNTPFYSF